MSTSRYKPNKTPFQQELRTPQHASILTQFDWYALRHVDIQCIPNTGNTLTMTTFNNVTNSKKHRSDRCCQVISDERNEYEEEKQPKNATLTHENLQHSDFHPTFPLITGSVCTHSLSTPSIGTLTTSDDLTVAEDWNLHSETISADFSETFDLRGNNPSGTDDFMSGESAAGTVHKWEALPKEAQPIKTAKAVEHAEYSLFGPNALTIVVQSWLNELQINTYRD